MDKDTICMKLHYKSLKDTSSKNISKLYTIVTTIEILAISSILLVCFLSLDSLTLKKAVETVLYCLYSFWVGEALRILCKRTILEEDLYNKYCAEHMLKTIYTIEKAQIIKKDIEK